MLCFLNVFSGKALAWRIRISVTVSFIGLSISFETSDQKTRHLYGFEVEKVIGGCIAKNFELRIVI